MKKIYLIFIFPSLPSFSLWRCSLLWLATSSYAIIKNASINSKKEELLANYKDIRSNLVRFEMMTNDTAKLVDKLKPYIEDVYELTKGDNDVDKIWESNEERIPRRISRSISTCSRMKFLH